MTTPPGGPTRDTTGTGIGSPAQPGTTSVTSEADTEGTNQQTNPTHSSAAVPGPAATSVDTEAAGGGPGSHGLTIDPHTLVTTEADTTQAGPPGATGPAYRAPSATAPAAEVDTTRTDKPVTDGSTSNTPPSSYAVGGTKDTSAWGGPVGSSGGTTVPTAMAKPTVAPGPRKATVTWVLPTGGAIGSSPLIAIEIQGSTGGSATAPKNVTSADVVNLVPEMAYTFRVRAVNGAGGGPWSPASNPVTPTNPDKPQ